MTGVEVDVALLRGLEISAEPVGIALLEHGLEHCGLAMLKLTEPDTVPASLLGAVLSVLIRTSESSAEVRALLADPDTRRASVA
jgi:hypothetical protein